MSETVSLLKKSKAKTVADQDQILDVSTELENLTQEKAEALAYELSNFEGQNEFKLGGVFSTIKTNSWFTEYKDFKTYVSEKYGIEYRKAQYCINIYERLVGEQISWDKVKDIGWTKVSIIVGTTDKPVLTAENCDYWVEQAQKHNCLALKALVKAAQNGAVPEDAEEVKQVSDVFSLPFKVHKDEKMMILEAVEKAKEESNTEFASVALTNICTGYLSGAVQANTTKSLLDVMKAAGLDACIDAFNAAWPSAKLELNGGDEVTPESALEATM